MTQPEAEPGSTVVVPEIAQERLPKYWFTLTQRPTSGPFGGLDETRLDKYIGLRFPVWSDKDLLYIHVEKPATIETDEELQPVDETGPKFVKINEIHQIRVPASDLIAALGEAGQSKLADYWKTVSHDRHNLQTIFYFNYDDGVLETVKPPAE